MQQQRDLIPVTWRDLPLAGPPRQWTAPLGLTVQEIVVGCPGLPKYFREIGAVCINGEEVPGELWCRVRPRAHAVVTMHLRLEGGGSSSKILASVAAVAVVLVAAVAAPFVAGALFEAGTVGFFATQAAIGAAGTIGGALLYSALAPPPAQTAGTTAGRDDPRVQTAALSGNTLRAGDNLARVLGYRRIFPSFVTQPIVELVGFKEVVEGVYGLAGPHKIDKVYASDIDISTMPEVSYQVTSGFPNAIQQTLVQRQGVVIAPNTELSGYYYDSANPNNLLDQGNPTADLPYYQRFVTRVNPDEFWLSISFQEGLIHTNGTALQVPVRVRIRVRGTTNWTDFPEVHCRSNLPAAFQATIKLMWQAAPGPLQSPDKSLGFVVAYHSTPNQNAGNGPFTGAFTSSNYFFGGGDTWWVGPAGTDNTASTGLQNMQMFADRVEFYLDPAFFPQAAYEVEVKRGQAIRTPQWWWSQYNYGGTVGTAYDLFGYYLTGGNVASVLEDQTQIKHKALIIRQSSIWNENPVSSGAPIAVIAVRSIGRSIQQLSCDAGGLCPIPVGGNFDTYAVSSNPADHYRDVLVGNLGAFPLQTTQIDDLTTWRNDCDALGYSINAVIQGMKQMDVQRLIASAGYAKPIQSETWGVAEDKDRSTQVPTQIFTPRNLSGFQWTKSFRPFTDGLRVKFDDALNLFVEQEQIVLDPEAQTGGIRLEDIRYETIVNPADATRRALFDLKQARRRLNFYTGTSDVENLVCRIGDLVGVNHEVLSTEIGYARVLSTIVNATGQLIGLYLDDSVPDQIMAFLNNPTLHFINDPALNFFNKPIRAGMMIRCIDGTFLVKEVTGSGGDVTQVAFVTPFTDPGTVRTGCLVGFGPIGAETRRLLIQEIKPKKDLTADITFVDEAADLWAGKITTALLHFDGTTGATTTVDSSSFANAVTMTNCTLQPTSKFGASSASFNGSSSLVTVTENDSLFFSQVDYTVDFWFNSSSATAQAFCVKGPPSGFRPWRLETDGTNILFYSASTANTAWNIANGLAVCPFPADGTFHHFAFVQSGVFEPGNQLHVGNYYIFFLDGVLQFSFYSTRTPIYAKDQITIGNYGSAWFNGFIDEFRYTNGLARWVSSFNPPVVAGTP